MTFMKHPFVLSPLLISLPCPYWASWVQKTSSLISPRVQVLSPARDGEMEKKLPSKMVLGRGSGGLTILTQAFGYAGCFQPPASPPPSHCLASAFSVVLVACLLMPSLSPGTQPFIFSTLLNWRSLFYLLSIFQNRLFNLSCVFSFASVQTFILTIWHTCLLATTSLWMWACSSLVNALCGPSSMWERVLGDRRGTEDCKVPLGSLHQRGKGSQRQCFMLHSCFHILCLKLKGRQILNHANDCESRSLG